MNRTTIDLDNKKTWPREAQPIVILHSIESSGKQMSCGFVVDKPEGRNCTEGRRLVVMLCDGPYLDEIRLINGDSWFSIDGITDEEITDLAETKCPD